MFNRCLRSGFFRTNFCNKKSQILWGSGLIGKNPLLLVWLTHIQFEVVTSVFITIEIEF
jgi:hypothetical protein